MQSFLKNSLFILMFTLLGVCSAYAEGRDFFNVEIAAEVVEGMPAAQVYRGLKAQLNTTELAGIYEIRFESAISLQMRTEVRVEKIRLALTQDQFRTLTDYASAKPHDVFSYEDISKVDDHFEMQLKEIGPARAAELYSYKNSAGLYKLDKVVIELKLSDLIKGLSSHPTISFEMAKIISDGGGPSSVHIRTKESVYQRMDVQHPKVQRHLKNLKIVNEQKNKVVQDHLKITMTDEMAQLLNSISDSRDTGINWDDRPTADGLITQDRKFIVRAKEGRLSVEEVGVGKIMNIPDQFSISLKFATANNNIVALGTVDNKIFLFRRGTGELLNVKELKNETLLGVHCSDNAIAYDAESAGLIHRYIYDHKRLTYLLWQTISMPQDCAKLLINELENNKKSVHHPVEIEDPAAVSKRVYEAAKEENKNNPAELKYIEDSYANWCGEYYVSAAGFDAHKMSPYQYWGPTMRKQIKEYNQKHFLAPTRKSQ